MLAPRRSEAGCRTASTSWSTATETRRVASRRCAAAIDWSYDLLDRDERCFFARLAVFPDAFDLEAAVVVAGAELTDPLRLLSALVRQSMVSVAGQDRYRLLDTIQAYALDVLGELDADDTQSRHARFYAGLAEEAELQIRQADQSRWLERLRAEVPNFPCALESSFAIGDRVVAARIAGALGWFWTLNGMLDEAVLQLERAATDASGPADVQAKVLWTYALLVCSLGQLERSEGDRRRRARNAPEKPKTPRRSGTGSTPSRLRNGRSATCTMLPRLTTRPSSASRRADEPWGRAVCMVLRRVPQSMAASVTPLRWRSGLYLPRTLQGINTSLDSPSNRSFEWNRPPTERRARSAAEEALTVQQSIGYTEGTIAALHVLGATQIQARDLPAARETNRHALALSVAIGHAAAICEALEGLARTRCQSDPQQAFVVLTGVAKERERRHLPLRASRAPGRRRPDAGAEAMRR